MKKRERVWIPQKLFVEDYRNMLLKEVEFFEAICALAGSTKGCNGGFKRSFGGEGIWRRICNLYDHFLGAARKGVINVKGDLANYPRSAVEIRPKIESRLRCVVRFNDLIHYSYLNRIEVPWILQTAFGASQSLYRPLAISVSIAKDKRSSGGECIVSSISFPLDFEVRTDALTARDKATISAQAAAITLMNLNTAIEKKDRNERIRQIPIVGEQIKGFCGEHTMRDWLKTVDAAEKKKGRPSKNRPLISPPKNLELPLNQTRPLYTPLAQEIEGYLARLKTAVVAIAATLAAETALSYGEISTHELVQNLLHPVCITVDQTEKKWEWANSWIHLAVEQAREK